MYIVSKYSCQANFWILWGKQAIGAELFICYGVTAIAI